MNKQLAFAFTAAALALGAALPQTAAAQRVIEETLVVRDPTVASSSQNGLLGAAAEYWYVSGEYNLYNNAGEKIADGDIKYKQPGFNVYAGYGDFTVLFTSRSGDGTLDFTYAPFALGPAAAISTHSKVEQEDREISLRWIFLKRRFFAPYVVAGYSWTDFEEEQTITTPGFFWTATGTPTRTQTIEYTAPLLGIGTIIPFSERFGARVDGRLKWYSAKRSGRGFSTVEDDGLGGDFTVTGYINIIQGLNLQLGGRFTSLNGGDLIGSSSRWGWFGMLGYTLRF